MKTLRIGFLCFVSLVLLAPFQAHASHLAGGYITYKITPIGGNNVLSFSFVILRNNDGINMPQSITAEYVYDCDTAVLQTVAPLNMTTVRVLPSNPCAPPNSGTHTHFEAYAYEGSFTIPNNRPCKDGVLRMIPYNARTSILSNLQAAGSGNFYLEAEIKRLAFVLANESPDPGLENLYFSSCINQTVTYGVPFPITGDSLLFERSTALSASNTPIGYTSGYSELEVIKSSQPNLYLSQTGQLIANANVPQVVTQANRIKQYKINPATGLKELVGITPLERLINVNNSCKPLALNTAMVKDTTSPGGNTIAVVPCETHSIVLEIDLPVLASTISTDGSEFAILNSAGYLWPIVKAYADDSLYHTQRIRIEFGVPIDYNDTLSLVLRKGSDFDGLVNMCGVELARDTALLVVNSCSGIGVAESPQAFFNTLFPNPMQETANIHCQYPTKLLVYTLNGQKLREQTLETGTHNLNLALQPGVFLVHIISKNQHHTQKIVVQP